MLAFTTLSLVFGTSFVMSYIATVSFGNMIISRILQAGSDEV